MPHICCDIITTMTSKKQIVRYIISGGSAAVVNLSLLYVLTEFFYIWYLVSATLAFISAFGVSFTLQKFWTFKDHKTDDIHKQLSFYLVVILVNLALNALFVYLLVEYTGIWYMFAQIISGLIIAIESFFVYKLVIFRRSHIASLDIDVARDGSK